ncbi:MAG: D-alanyl-D-alanine carboxypeptidase/D-alanyl-D-alanine endopeptidase [Armatimonadota bacterium]
MSYPSLTPKRVLPQLLLLAFWALAVVAAPPANLRQVVEDGLKAPALRGAHVGILIKSLRDGSTWFTRRANERFIPASVAKIVTGMLALDQLGKDYRFSTCLLATGEIADGVLQGDLILQGGGDPVLTSEDYSAMAQVLAAGNPERGIPAVTRIAGKVVLDSAFFPRPGPLLGAGWEAEDLPWYYATPSNALSCNRNAVKVTIRGTEPGQPPLLTVTPATGLYTFENNAMTSADVKAGAAEMLPQGCHVTIRGQIAPGVEFTERLSVPDPLKYVSEQFCYALQGAGIRVEGAVCETKNAAPKLLAEHQSVTLAEILQPMLKDSDNFISEQLRWTMLALKQTTRDLSHRYPAILADFATRYRLPGKGMRLVDGSGLSRQNGLSPAVVVALFAGMSASPDFDLLYQALPVAGVDGTLKKRMIGTPAEGVARAKTGTMRGVCTLAGVVDTLADERLVFAVFAEGYRGGAPAARKLQDDLVSYLAGLTE